MQAVMTLLGKEPTWAEAKRQLGERKLQEKIKLQLARLENVSFITGLVCLKGLKITNT